MFAEIKSNGLLVCGAVVAALGMASTNTPIYGSETASATIALASNQIVGGQTQYTYDLALTNTSTDGSTVGTFWFAWIPHQSYLANNPISISSPTGWEDGPDSQMVGGPLGEKGASIEWQASGVGSYLAAGDTIRGFSFTTVDSPSSVFGDSVYFPGTPVLTSQVYHAGPFSDSSTSLNGYQLVAQVVPEPTTLVLLGLASTGLLLVSKRHLLQG
ncbi:MAG: PEP-CTERM sorting domain-containing protein [Phycisphaerae bacterium]